MVLPVLVAADLALLLSAHICRGASTEVAGQAPFGALKPHTASDDNLFSAIKRLSQAHAWAFVFIVAVMSGIWPYVKLLGTAVAVQLAHSGVVARRKSILALRLIEVLGKYSFADIFLICLNSVIFNIKGGPYRIILVGKLEVDMRMQLKYATLALVFAITISTFLTHWAAHELTRQELLLEECDDDDDLFSESGLEQRRPLLGEEGSWGEGEHGPEEAHTAWITACALLAPLIGAVALVSGARTPMLSIYRGGFLGNLIRPMEDQVLQLSPVSVANMMLSNAENRPDVSYVHTMVVMFVLLTTVAPFLELLFLAATSLSAAVGRRRAAGVARMCADWLHSFDCVDVLMIVVLITLIDLHTVVEFNVGSECKPFADIMNNRKLLTLAGIGFAASPSCFEPVPQLQEGFGVLMVAVALRSISWRLADRLLQPKDAECGDLL